jgi:hypothetical protein
VIRSRRRIIWIASFAKLLGSDEEHGTYKESLPDEIQSNARPHSVILGPEAYLGQNPKPADETE